MYCSLSDLVAKKDMLYSPAFPGILIVRDRVISKALLCITKKIEHGAFTLKEYPHINNGQTYYHFVPTEALMKTGDLAVKSFVELEQLIRSKIAVRIPESEMQYGFTRYPVSMQGAAFHIDFSYNGNCTITFFFGYTSIFVAQNKNGEGKVKYGIEPGDIVIMRAPRDTSSEEIALRPIHAVSSVSEAFYAFEAREVNMIKKNLKK